MSGTELRRCPEGLDENALLGFARRGFLAFRDCLTAQEVDAARVALARLADRDGGSVLVQREPGASSAGPIRKLMHFQEHDPFLAALCREQPRIRGVVRSLLGDGAELFQDMALVKPARVGSEKPWHQDAAYFNVLPLDGVAGVWIALDDSDVRNGCMHVLPAAHLAGPRRHVHAPVLMPQGEGVAHSRHTDCQIAPGRLDVTAALPIELPAGGALFFSPLLPHQTPPNASDRGRRALQLHYRGAETRLVDAAEYDSVFADADGAASCAAADGIPSSR